MKITDEIKKKASKIKLIAFDCDGVLSNGDITLDNNGVEYKTFNVKDGQGIVRVRRAGFPTAIITARECGCVSHRAKDLKIAEVYQGAVSKLPALTEIMKKYNLKFSQVAYMGDDLPDICILERVGLACCPNDAASEVIELADFVSQKDGGKGAVREMCDLILDSQNIKKEYVISEGMK